MSRSSTSELVYFLSQRHGRGVSSTTVSSSRRYVCGIITDTGNFEHGYYTGDTMRTDGPPARRGSGRGEGSRQPHLQQFLSPDRITAERLLHSIQPDGGPPGPTQPTYG
ncbi:MAG: hypothetical protein MZV63_11575 [Marinilabiliales bacterium]|nr:hypothetical protein [Marinilabiliales bacterium]